MQKKVKLAWLGSIVLILSLCSGGMKSFAQTITGSIRGTVTDPSGAVVQRASVIATNVDTGVATHTVTDRSGLYNIQFLPIGNYRVKVTATGFAEQELGPFALQIDQIAAINARLSVGSTETVRVDESTSTLNTENATVSTSISSETLENMPLNGLNVEISTLFVPGAVIPDQTALSGVQGTERDAYTTHGAESADAQPTFNGNRQQNNSYILDGIDINETLQNAVGYNPSPFSIQEVHVITSNADAEFGNVNGGEVVMVTKGGTNHIHGSIFEYHENSGLTANTWSNKNNPTIVPRSHFNQNQFGMAVGGPIIKNKLFFFGNFIGLWRTDSGLQQESVPTADERGQAPGDPAGYADLSGVVNVEGIAIESFPNGTNTPVPYANNLVPILNPVAKYVFAESLIHPGLLPLPNTTPGPGGLTDGNFNGPFADSTRNNQGDVRIDYTLNNNNTFMGKYSHGEAYDNQSQVPMEVLFPASNDYPFTNVSLAYTHIFSPKVVNNLRGGFTRIVLNQNSFTDPSGLFGLHGDQTVGIPLPNQPIAGFSYMAFNNNADLSNWGTAYYLEAYNLDNNFDYNDILTWEHGNHVTKFGVDFVRYQQDYFAPSNIGGENGNFTYSGSFADYSYADFLTDQASTNQIAGVTGPFGQRQWRDAVFVQDDWRVRHNLTLNLGLRWSYDQPIYEVNNKMVNVNIPLASFAPVGTPIANMLEYAGAYNPATGKTNSRALYNPYYYNFMPRFGLAWTVRPRLVIRGGFGMTDELESTGTGLRMTQNPPFQPSFVQNAPQPGPTSAGGPALAVENGFQLSAGNNTNTNGSSYRAWDPDIHPAITSQMNLTAQYLISNNTSFTIGYVGQISKHLAVPIALNQYTEDVPDSCDDTCYQTIIPFNQLVGQGGEVIETASRANANYNSLQATIRRQQSNGLMFLVNYAYAKSLTNNPGYFNVDAGSDEDSYWQDINHPNEDYGPSNFDLRHNVSGTILYQLPFGRGKKFGSNWGRLTDEIAGGWQLASNFEIHTGFPLGIAASPHCNDNCPEIQTGDYFAPANQYRHMKIVNRGRQPDGTFNWFGNDPSVTPCSGHGVDNGTCAYGKIADFGNAKPGSQYGPGFDNWDLALQKAFKTVGGESLTVRVDAFNAFNISSYGNPGSNTGSPSAFGVITGTRSGPRTLQLSGVYRF
jgi:hypothetical protein